MANFLIVKNHSLCCCCCFEVSVKSVFFQLLFQVDFRNLSGSPRNVIVFLTDMPNMCNELALKCRQALKTAQFRVQLIIYSHHFDPARVSSDES